MVYQTERPEADISGPDRMRPYLVISLDGALYGLEISQVRHISRLERIWRLPCQPDCVKGVTIIGDRVLTLIDLRLKLGLPEIAYHSNTCAERFATVTNWGIENILMGPPTHRTYRHDE